MKVKNADSGVRRRTPAVPPAKGASAVSCMSELLFPDFKNVGSSRNDGIHLIEKI